jgi:hypothetical protein
MLLSLTLAGLSAPIVGDGNGLAGRRII